MVLFSMSSKPLDGELFTDRTQTPRFWAGFIPDQDSSLLNH
jgi:hypothetical protein